MTIKRPGPRCLLWVDAVGGYLVCLGDEVSLGQAVPGTGVEIPILGDLSRRHAVIRRDDSDYLVSPLARVTVDGRSIDDVTLLQDGDELEFGTSVRLRFRKPHPLSASARLDFLSHHRTQPSSDAIVLMADSCLLGPAETHHVVCRMWSNDVALSRTSDGRFRFRAAEGVEVDGQSTADTGIVDANSRLVGSDFALSLEGL